MLTCALAGPADPAVAPVVVGGEALRPPVPSSPASVGPASFFSSRLRVTAHATLQVLASFFVRYVLQNIYCGRFSKRATLLVGSLLVNLVIVPLVSAASLSSYVGQPNRFNTDGAAWCADFAVHVTGDALPIKPSRSAKQLYTRFKAAGLLTKNPQPGDLVFFWRESPTSWKGHVGVVESVTSDTLTTVEGNVSNRVQRRTYPRHAIPRLLGFGKVR